MRAPAGTASAPRPLLLSELRLPAETLAQHLVEGGEPLDAFLLAAGLRQITEDLLEPDVLRLAELRRLAGDATGAAIGAAATAAAALRTRPAELVAWDARLGRLVDALADALVTGGGDHRAEARALADALPWSVRRARSRLPTCFQGLDQHPEDVRRLVERLGATTPPVVVAGLRTSGSYLAPLTAAWLRAAGHAGAVAITLRPDVPLPAAKRRLLRAAGTVVITDDPPASGGSLAQVGHALERIDVPAHAIVVLVQLLAGDRHLPAALERYRSVVLPWEAWSVHDRLRPDAVADALRALDPDRRIAYVERVHLRDAPARGHCAARFAVTVDDGREDVFVRGVGLGYFGHHALAVEQALDPWIPPSYGVADGLLYRPWLPDERRARAGDPEQVARYIAVRRHRLAIAADSTEDLFGQAPVWEVASNLLSQAYARAWRPMRVLAVDAAVREILRPQATSVVDGRMARDAWFVAADGTSLLKVKAAERAFSNRNLACADAAFDVTGAAVAWPEQAVRLREAFAREAAEWIDDERWLLLRLVALWALERDGDASPHEVRRASARVLQEYFAAVYLDDVPRSPEGPLCALDLDGVLETETLGYPGLSPAGALALRALLAHGYRPVIASGRSLGEVAERCRSYRLDGGVAEYGAAMCGPGGAAPTTLLPMEAAAAMGRAGAALEAFGAELGPDHAHALRAWWRDQRGRRGPLSPAALAAAQAAAAPVTVRAIAGDAQTDLVPAGVDKATGVRALLDALGEAPPLALAFGDQAADLPLLALAERPLAPGNAAAAVRRSGTRVLRRPYQAGLAQGVGAAIGHAPGSCAVCQPPPAGRRRRLLLSILAARERGGPGLAMAAVRLGLLADRR